MTYSITITKGAGYTYDIAVAVLTDDGSQVMTGQTSVIADSEEQAKSYAEEVYMPDLRRNYRELAGLVLASEIPPEQPMETPADGGANNAEPTAPETI